MYNSPIEMIIGNMQMQQEGEIFRAVQNIGVNVDKDELLKALQYDRGQYEKGYKDGIKDGIKDFAERLKNAFPESDRNNVSPAICVDLYCEIVEEIAEEMTEGGNGNII